MRILISILILSSCSGNSKVEYDNAALKICNCMSKKTGNETNSEMVTPLPELEYSMCILEIRNEINPTDKGLLESIKTECPDLLDLHKDFLQTENENIE